MRLSQSFGYGSVYHHGYNESAVQAAFEVKTVTTNALAKRLFFMKDVRGEMLLVVMTLPTCETALQTRGAAVCPDRNRTKTILLPQQLDVRRK